MIDKLPTPPTDNLYKFGAMIGLVMWLGGYAAQIFITTSFVDRSEKISRESAELAKASKTETERAIAQQAIHSMTTQHNNLVTGTANMREGLHWAPAVGIILMFGNISWWYARYQRHQDRSVVLETDQKRLQNTLAELEIEKLRLEVAKLKEQEIRPMLPNSTGPVASLTKP